MAKQQTHGLKYWVDQAKDVDASIVRLPAPMHVLLGEATDLAAFVTKYWEPVIDAGTKRVSRPGLKSAVTKRADASLALNAHIAEDIQSLADATRELHSKYLVQSRPVSESKVERARLVHSEVTSALEYLFDDGVEDENDTALANLESEHHANVGSHDGLALALEDYGTLAQSHRDALDGLGGFDASMLDEIPALAKDLRATPSVAGAAASDEDSTEAIASRNRLVGLLLKKIATVRAAAKFVFRLHPEISREAMSAYGRRRRAIARGAKKKSATGGTPGGSTPSKTG